MVPEWPIFMQVRILNPHSFTGPKSTVLIGPKGASLIRQWNPNVDIAAWLWLDGESLSPIG